MVNGVPFWHHVGLGEAASAEDEALLGLAGTHIVASVAYIATDTAASTEDVVVVERHNGVAKFIFGAICAPNGGAGGHCAASEDEVDLVVALLASFGVPSERSDDIRSVVWTKLMGNTSWNCIAALTRSNMAACVADERLSGIARAVMEETVAVAAAMGIRVGMSVEKRMELSAKLRQSTFSPSMCQDALAGRRLEVDAIADVVVRLGARLNVPTPTTAMLAALTGGLDNALRK